MPRRIDSTQSAANATTVTTISASTAPPPAVSTDPRASSAPYPCPIGRESCRRADVADLLATIHAGLNERSFIPSPTGRGSRVLDRPRHPRPVRPRGRGDRRERGTRARDGARAGPRRRPRGDGGARPGQGRRGPGRPARGPSRTASLELVELDLASLASVRACADAIVAAHDTVDLLVNNAGLMAMPERAHGRRLRDAVRRQPPRPLGADQPPAAAPAGRARRPAWWRSARRPTTWAGWSTRTTRTWRATTARGGPTASPSWPTCTSRSGWTASSGATPRTPPRWPPTPGLTNSDLQARTRPRAGRRPGAGRARGHALDGHVARPRGAVAAARGHRPERARAASSTGRCWVNSGPPVRKPLLRRFDLDRGIRRLWEVSRRETGAPLDVAGAAARPRDDARRRGPGRGGPGSPAAAGRRPMASTAPR